jgi:thioredoxin 1
MLTRRQSLALVGICFALFTTATAMAQGKQAFDATAFEAAQAAGKPILVEVTAPWCPTCKAQAPILSKLMGDPRFKNLVVYNIDYDSQKDLLKKFNVQRQSTLVVFRGKQETGRSTGDTNAASIEALLAKAI